MATTVSTSQQPVRKRSRVLHAGSVGMLVGGVIATIGSLLPWVSTPFGSLSGTGGGGLWTLCAGFLAIAGALLPYRMVAIAHCLLPGLAIAVIATWQVARLVTLSAQLDSWGQLLPGMGLVMVAGAAAILLRTGIRLIRT